MLPLTLSATQRVAPISYNYIYKPTIKNNYGSNCKTQPGVDALALR